MLYDILSKEEERNESVFTSNSTDFTSMAAVSCFYQK